MTRPRWSFLAGSILSQEALAVLCTSGTAGDDGFGSIATGAADPASHLLSGLVRKRPHVVQQQNDLKSQKQTGLVRLAS